jgi:hypothetical protein
VTQLDCAGNVRPSRLAKRLAPQDEEIKTGIFIFLQHTKPPNPEVRSAAKPRRTHQAPAK